VSICCGQQAAARLTAPSRIQQRWRTPGRAGVSYRELNPPADASRSRLALSLRSMLHAVVLPEPAGDPFADACRGASSSNPARNV